MPQKKQQCKNHRDRLTARRCYQCQDPICTECEQTFEHHRFCSYYCYSKWKLQSIAGNLHFSRENIFIFAVILILNLIFFLYLNSKLNQLIDNKDSVSAAVQDSLENKVSSPVQIDTVRFPLQNILQVRLGMKPGSVIALRRGKDFIKSKVQKNGTLLFDDLHLYIGKNRFAIFRMQNEGQSQLIDSFTIDIKSSRIDYLKLPIDQIKSREKLVALTFDGGSLDIGTEQILKILRETGTRCSIFLTGAFLKKYPELVNEMIEDGHEIGNHSYSHPHLTEYAINSSNKQLPEVDRDFLDGELLKTDSLFQIISGYPMAPLWRAPFGEINNDILLWAAEAGFKHVGWSRYGDTHDWVTDPKSGLYRSGEGIINHLLGLEERDGLSGKIILMHLSSDRKIDQPYLVLKEMIEKIKARGYRFVTVSQLLIQT
jgi:peptidoglycan/xylan/chitin deacetylase (PgdA/CDA1 family)